MRDLLETACRIKARGEFVAEALVLNKAVLPRQPDGLFIETLGVQLPAFQARNLGADQSCAVCEGFRAGRRPPRELLVMSR